MALLVITSVSEEHVNIIFIQKIEAIQSSEMLVMSLPITLHGATTQKTIHISPS
jgi:hypothetical protein